MVMVSSQANFLLPTSTKLSRVKIIKRLARRAGFFVSLVYTQRRVPDTEKTDGY
jgi:hypothetical protein